MLQTAAACAGFGEAAAGRAAGRGALGAAGRPLRAAGFLAGVSRASIPLGWGRSWRHLPGHALSVPSPGATSCLPLPSLRLRAQFRDVSGILNTRSGKNSSLSASRRATGESVVVGFSRRFALVSRFPIVSPCLSFFPSCFTFLNFFFSFLIFFQQKNPNQSIMFLLPPSPFPVRSQKPCSGCKRAFPPLFFLFLRRFCLPCLSFSPLLLSL